MIDYKPLLYYKYNLTLNPLTSIFIKIKLKLLTRKEKMIQKIMVNNMQITFLNDIKPRFTSYRVQVKVLHSWRQWTKMAGDSLELVLSDAHVSVLFFICFCYFQDFCLYSNQRKFWIYGIFRVQKFMHRVRRLTWMSWLRKFLLESGSTLITSVWRMLPVHFEQPKILWKWISFTTRTSRSQLSGLLIIFWIWLILKPY